MIQGVARKTQIMHTGKLLRRPLPPKILPALVTNKGHESQKDVKGGSVINIFQNSFNLDALTYDGAEWDSISTDGESTDSILACPPPTSGSAARQNSTAMKENQALIQANTYCTCPSLEKNNVLSTCDEKKYILDSVYRDRTAIGSHVNGDSLVKIRKLRGPDPLPARAAKKIPEMVMFYESDDERYYQSPAFMLEHFLYKFARMKRMSIPQVRSAIYSKHNFQKLTNLIAAELKNSQQENLHTVVIDCKYVLYILMTLCFPYKKLHYYCYIVYLIQIGAFDI